MLNLKFIRENADLVQNSAREKGYKNVEISALLSEDDARKKLLAEVENLRETRNLVAREMKNSGGKNQKPDENLIKKGREIKEKLAILEENLRAKSDEINQKLAEIPNIIFDDVPRGGEENSVEIRAVGEKRTDAKIDHLDFANSRDWLDFERGAKVAGAKFYYLKNELFLLEQALISFAIEKLSSPEVRAILNEKSFTFMQVPEMVNSKILAAAGYAPKTDDENADYFVENNDLALIATAEIPLTGYFADEILAEKDLPIYFAGLSSCYRREAGAAGKWTRGLFRVHQFDKLEMYAFCTPEKSREIHEKLLRIEESIWRDLKIPYRVINIAAGDLGAPAAKKYDIEYWSPNDEKYRELTSCSNCTDFQANSLNIRVRRNSAKKPDGEIEILHTLNGTGISFARTLVALIENYAQTDGKMKIPEVLRKYFGGKEIL